MKLWKHSLFTALAFFGITGTVFYSSCEKDSCEELRCRNGGACVEGFCRCPEGYEGSECELQAGAKFIGEYIGHTTCELQPLLDTVDIWMIEEPRKLLVVQHSRITDTIEAIAVGDNLDIPVREDGNNRKTFEVGVNANRLTFFYEEIYDVNNPANKRTCNFIGYK